MKEISTNSSYLLNTSSFNVSVEYNKTSTINITNDIKRGHIKILKTDSETSAPIKGVTFELINANGNVVKTGTTNSNGELTFNDIRIGKYSLKEVSTNENYVLNTSVFDVDVKYNEVTTQTITNDFKKGNIKVYKIDDQTSAPIEGVTFKLYKTDGTLVGTAITNSKGEAFFDNIRIGDYTIKEISTNQNYILNTNTFDVKVEYNKTTTKTIENEHKKGNLFVLKVDKDNNRIPLGNVIFDLYSEEFDKVVGTYTTDVNGELNINNIRTGNYKLIERNTGKWYNLAEDTPIIIEYNTTTNTIVENELKKGQVQVIKTDKEDNSIRISGVVFEVLDQNNKVLETIVTNADGIAKTDRYAIRDYETLKLREIMTDKYYVLNSDITSVQLKENETTEITIQNELKKGQIKVIKVDKDNNEIKLEGIEFNVYDEQNNIVDTLITDSNGEAISKKLPINQQYIVKEIKTLNDYILNDEPQIVELEYDKIIDLTFTNELKKGQLQVIKLDKDNNAIKLAGIEFNILNEKGEIVDVLITDENGQAISKRLPINQKYSLLEVKTLKNYELDETKHTFTLKENEISQITLTNELKKGKLQLIKVDYYNNEIKLEGVEFNIYDEDMNIVDTLTTDINGVATSKRLRTDKQYIIEEIKTLDDYVLNQDTYTISLTHNEITQKVITNELKKGKIKILKVDKDNNDIKLEGVEFNIYDDNQNLVDTIITDSNGEAISKELRVDKTYTIQESKTLSNYVLNTYAPALNLKPSETTTITIENEKIKGFVEISKTDEKTNAPLKGAIFGIYDMQNNEIQRLVTDELGKAKSTLIDIGKYYIKEIDPGSVYYLLNENIYEFEILNNHEIVPISITNIPVQISVNVEKTGYIETQKNDTIRYNFSNIANTSNIYLNSFKWKDYLPTEYIRLSEIVTGTWNQDITYSITYKTNLNNNEQILADNLNSKENHKINCSNIGLADNEYITEYSFNFGKVDIGFKEVISPSIFCVVLESVKDTDTFTNRTETIGNYHDLTDTASDEWTTIIYEKDLIAKDKTLPRTGK